MKCRSCGFSAATFPVLIANEAELKKAVGNMKKKAAKKNVKKKISTRNSVPSKLATKVASSSGKKKVVKKK